MLLLLWQNAFIQAQFCLHYRKCDTILHWIFRCKKKKNWLINKYNFLWFCSRNLGELLYCKYRKLTPSDKVWLYLAWSRFHSDKMYSFLRPLTESYSQTFSKVFRSYYLRLTMAWTKRFEALFIVSLWLWVSKFFLKWSVFEFWVLMSEGYPEGMWIRGAKD